MRLPIEEFRSALDEFVPTLTNTLVTAMDVGQLLGCFHDFCILRTNTESIKQWLRSLHGNYVDGLWYELTQRDPCLHFEAGHVSRVDHPIALRSTTISLSAAIFSHFNQHDRYNHVAASE